MSNKVKRQGLGVTLRVVSLMLATALSGQYASAETKVPPAGNERWKSECGSCHIAYPPQFLPAPAWKRIMTGLDTHFGTDASVDARSAAEIGAFLDSNAGRGRRAQGATDTLRITGTAWFRHEHDEVPAATWTRPAVKSASNCAACHTLAEQGDFRERNIRIPR